MVLAVFPLSGVSSQFLMSVAVRPDSLDFVLVFVPQCSNLDELGKTIMATELAPLRLGRRHQMVTAKTTCHLGCPVQSTAAGQRS